MHVAKALQHWDGYGKTTYENCQDIAKIMKKQNIVNEDVMLRLLAISLSKRFYTGTKHLHLISYPDGLNLQNP